jgi:sporulation-control protein
VFRKLLSSIGIGGAKVDTRLGADSFLPGEMVSGEVYITGGGDAQELNRIYISVVTTYKHDDSTHEYTLGSQDVSGSLRIEANENRSIPFTFNLPRDTPLSLGHTRIYIKTGLDVPNALDPSDRDEIQVGPDAVQQAVLDAAQNLGFRLYQVENEYSPSKGYPHPFVQQLELKPSGGGRYAGRVEELELIFKPREDGLDVLVELDRRASSLGGFLESAMELNERFDRLHVTPAEARTNAVEGMLSHVIETHTR